jgi:ASC-1-like (ASCH) protein
MIIHPMKLNKEPFDLIKEEIKTVEMRLYDEKRRKIRIGDIIEFTNNETNEVIKCIVVNLHLFSDFKELYAKFDKRTLGYLKDEDASYTDMFDYYSKDEIEEYGVVGIEIELMSIIQNFEYDKDDERLDKISDLIFDKMNVKKETKERIK